MNKPFLHFMHLIKVTTGYEIDVFLRIFTARKILMVRNFQNDTPYNYKRQHTNTNMLYCHWKKIHFMNNK